MKYTKQAFTLVELIVVITILAILGTIAFISLQGYSKDARNTTRISDMKNVEQTLELYALEVGKYPTPDNSVAHTASGGTEVLFHSGDFGENAFRAVEKVSEIPTDPQTGDYLEYSVTTSSKDFELKANLELTANSQVNGVYAAETEPRVRGSYNGLYLVGDQGNYHAVPSLFADDSDLDNEATYSVRDIDVLFTAVDLGVTTTTIKNNYGTFGTTLQGAYSGATDLNTGGIYKDLQETSDVTEFVQTLVEGPSTSTSETTSGYIADGSTNTSEVQAAVGGTAISSAVVGGNPASNAFDGNIAVSSPFWYASDSTGIYIGYTFSSDIVVNKVGIRSRTGGWSQAPVAFSVEGRASGGSWEVLETYTGGDWTGQDDITKWYSFTNSTAYSEYRINDLIDFDGAPNVITLGEVYFIEAELSE